MGRPTPVAPGFTLLETLLVVALIMVVAAVLAPAMLPSPNTQLRASAGQVASALRQTRLVAMRERRPSALQVDTDARTLQVPGAANPIRLDEGISLQLTTAETEMLGGSSGGIRFFPDGSSTGGRISLANEARILHVDIEWLTGRVRLLEDDGA